MTSFSVAGGRGQLSPQPSVPARPPAGTGPAGDRYGRAPYGFVVEGVNVSVLLYVPVRRASPAPMACLKATATGSLLTGPAQVSSGVGLEEPPTAVGVPPVAVGLVAAARSGCGSAKVPLTRWPVAVADASATVSAASPALLITLAVMLAS